MVKRIFEDRVQKLEEVPEADRDFYEEAQDGNGFTLANPKGLKSNNRDLKAEKIALQEKHNKLEADIAKYTALGDYDKLSELKTKQREIEQAQITNNAELETWKRDFTKTKDEELSAEKEKRQRLLGKFENDRISGVLERALTKAGATTSSMTHLKTLLRPDIKAFWEDDEPVLKVVDAKGAPKRNKELDPMTIDELVATIKKDIPHFFKSGGGSGGGSNPSDDSGDPVEFDKKPSTWTAEKQRKYINLHGHESYREAVKAEAAAKVKAA